MKYGNLTLGQIEAGINKIGGEDAFMRLLAGELNVVPAKPADPKKLLELMTTVSVAACEKFVAKENFKVDTGKKAKVKIAFLWDNFSKYFLPKTEEGVLAGEIKVHKLLQSSLDAPIMTELGDPRSYSTTLADMWGMLEKQPGGEEGALLVNGYANIFYIHDTEGNLWAVRASWYAGLGGWGVEADSVGRPRRWGGGRQVLSR
jgi:hypothetical protein